MGELFVRRNRGFAVPRYQAAAKTEKQAGAAPAQKALGRQLPPAPELLQQLSSRVGRAQRFAQEARRSLQTGEAALAEMQKGLYSMEELAEKAAGEGEIDRQALQEVLGRLRDEIGRIARGGAQAGLFTEGADGLDPDALVSGLLSGLSGKQEGMEGLPAWLVRGLMESPPDKETLLKALGLDASASGAELAAALGRLSLQDSAAAGYLAGLYLGAVIAGGGSPGDMDPALAAEGLRQLLEAIAGGAQPDQAISALTNGAFTSLADFEAQLAGGTAPGLEDFLSGLLLSGESAVDVPPLLALLGGGGEGGFDLLMGLLSALENAGQPGPGEAAPAENAAPQPDTAGQGASSQGQALEMEGARAAGPGVSGASFDGEAGVLTLRSHEPLTLSGQGQMAPAVRLLGEGPLGLRQVHVPELSVQAPGALAVSEGENVVSQLRLGGGAALTLEGRGFTHILSLGGGAGSVLRLTGGAVEIAGQEAGSQARILVDGPVSLLAPPGALVQDAQGNTLEPFDVLWKALLPGWSMLTGLGIDGQQGQLALLKGQGAEALRMWFSKGDPSQGYPAHMVVLQGRDQAGRLRTRYVYLRWSQRDGAFREAPMYPNPFTVTGGQQDRDWRYEEESQTLQVLTGQVTAIAGGTGEDAGQSPFSGRVALSDGLGPIELILEGVQCRVPSGRAFSLGGGNQVSLVLRRGTESFFESGPGCAGISLGDGTSLKIDQTRSLGDEPEGELTAIGGSGSAGIGRDSGVGQGSAGTILIRGGRVKVKGGGLSAAPQAAAPAGAPAVPKFRVSLESLGLNSLDITTRESARKAVEALEAGQKKVARMRGAYSAMYGRLEKERGGMSRVQRYIRMVQDPEEAGALFGAHSQWGLEDLSTLLW